jgi:hypothetical protein
MDKRRSFDPRSARRRHSPDQVDPVFHAQHNVDGLESVTWSNLDESH